MTVEVAASEWFNSEEVLNYFKIVSEESDISIDPEAKPQLIGEKKVDLRCGPILRLLGTYNNQLKYRGSLLLVINGDSEYIPHISYKLGPSDNVKENLEEPVDVKEGTFEGHLIHTEGALSFFRFDINFPLAKWEQKCKYDIECVHEPEYQFYIPATFQSMNVMFYSCNGFSYNTDGSKYKGTLWYDVLRNHMSSGLRYHVMIGGGDQIYSDVVKRDTRDLKEWLSTTKAESRKNIEKSAEYLGQLNNFYLNHYLNWYGRGYLNGTKNECFIRMFPRVLATIPSINIFDDHDIIDGFGSYEDNINGSDMFLGIGKMAMKHYLLFQHHTSMEEVHSGAIEKEPSWVIGSKIGRYIKQRSMSVYLRLGKKIGFIGLDCRTERSLDEVVVPETYEIVFNRIKKELKDSNYEIKHLYILLGVPILYPRLVLLEKILNSPTTKVLAGLLRKLHIGSGAIQEIDGGIDIVDDMNDHWCSDNHKNERNKLVARLQQFLNEESVRITFLGGDVHLAAVGRMRGLEIVDEEPHHKQKFLHIHEHHRKHFVDVEPLGDPRLMFNVISSAITNHPPPDKVAQMMFNVQKKHHFGDEALEDMVPIFKTEPDEVTLRSSVRHIKHHNVEFMNKRNYSDLIPVENSHKYQIGGLKYPGPVHKESRESIIKEKSHTREDSDEKVHHDIGYPVDVDGLAATIHVEKNIKDPEASTFDYEVIIPLLNVFSKAEPLNQTHVKYVH